MVKTYVFWEKGIYYYVLQDEGHRTEFSLSEDVFMQLRRAEDLALKQSKSTRKSALRNHE